MEGDVQSTGLRKEELRQWSRPEAWRTWAQIGWIWASMAALFVGATWVGWWAMLLAIPLMARQQLCLGALMHDAAHRRLFASRTWNDHVSQLLCAGPLLLVSDGYRRTHLKHHRRTMENDDPDIGISGGYPIEAASLYRRLFRDISGQTYIKFIRHFIAPTKRTASVSKEVLAKPKRDGGVKLWVSLVGMLVVHASILSAAFAIGNGFAYLVLWMVPQMTFLQVFLRIRGITEHAMFEPNADARRNSRTVVNRWQTFWVAPLNLSYHIEHHLYPSVPFYHLARVHQTLKQRGHLEGAFVYDSYVPVMRELLSVSPTPE